MNDCTQTPASGESQSNKQSKAPPAAMSLSAMALLSAAPLPVPMDAQAWYIQPVALVHDLIYATVNATRVPADTGAQATLAQQALTKHAALITQSHPPVVVTRDGQHTIAYDELGEARAKVKVLKAELEQALKELVPARVDAAEWLEEHEWRLHDLLHKTARMAKNRVPVSGGVHYAHNRALRALLAHAQGVPARHLPVVLDATGKATIPYELFAASRAQVRELGVELEKLHARSTTKPGGAP